VLAACGDGSGAEDSAPADVLVVASTTILGDLVENVVGEDATVVVLTPVGADPHDFQPSAAQVATINEADLVVANGLGLEEGLADVLAAAADDGVRIIEVAPLLDPIPFASDEEGGGTDPHVWLDPRRMGEAGRLIAAELAEVDPNVDWAARATAYADELAAVDSEVSNAMSSIPAADRKLVTNHDSMGYFAERYGFQVVGAVIPAGSTLADPSARELAQLVEVMEREGVTVIFAETTRPSALAEAVAAELGSEVQVVSLYTGSLGEQGSGADSLVGMLRTNAALIAVALSG
jgi:zinc/manganese transport system substrate-binding protein